MAAPHHQFSGVPTDPRGVVPGARTRIGPLAEASSPPMLALILVAKQTRRRRIPIDDRERGFGP